MGHLVQLSFNSNPCDYLFEEKRITDSDSFNYNFIYILIIKFNHFIIIRHNFALLKMLMKKEIGN